MPLPRFIPRALADRRWTGVFRTRCVSRLFCGVLALLLFAPQAMTALAFPPVGGEDGLQPGFPSSRSGRVTQTGARLTAFERDVLPILTKAGCNSGSCHASPKPEQHGGFRLSPLGSRSTDDYVAIVDGPGNVLIDPAHPEKSLLLLRATAAVPHKGAERRTGLSKLGAGLSESGSDARGPLRRAVLRWIAGGTPVSKAQNARPRRLEVTPKEILARPGQEISLTVHSYEHDGTKSDVTDRAVYSAGESISLEGDAVATVSASGQVKIVVPGRCIVFVRYAGRSFAVPVSVPFSEPVKHDRREPEGFVDRLLVRQWERMGLEPAGEADDFRFIRRAYLRLIGRLPNPDDVVRFAESDDVDKRGRLVESLLNRPEYASHWTSQWLSLLEMSEGGLSAAEQALFAEWLRESFRENRPISDVVRDLLTAQGTPETNGAVLFYKVHDTPQMLAEATAGIFLGVRGRCFRCHDDPRADWRPDDFHALAACFAGVSLKQSGGRFGVYCDPNVRYRHPETARPVRPSVLGIPLKTAFADADPGGDDTRRALADLLVESRHRLLARRVVDWYWMKLFGGSLTGTDRTEFGLSQPAVHPELLNALAEDFARHDYDVKRLLRTMCRSRAFGLDQTESPGRDMVWTFFHARFPKRLGPETLVSMIEQVTEVSVDEDDRQYFRAIGGFGTRKTQRGFQPNKCHRHGENEVNIAAALHLINSDVMQRLITHPQGRVARLAASEKSDREILDELVLCTMSRYAKPETAGLVEEYAAKKRKENVPRRQVFEDVLWALINTREFLFVD